MFQPDSSRCSPSLPSTSGNSLTPPPLPQQFTSSVCFRVWAVLFSNIFLNAESPLISFLKNLIYLLLLKYLLQKVIMAGELFYTTLSYAKHLLLLLCMELFTYEHLVNCPYSALYLTSASPPFRPISKTAVRHFKSCESFCPIVVNSPFCAC